MAYPFKGSCASSTANSIYGYQGTGINLPSSVGLYASARAAVRADGNDWLRNGKENQDWVEDGDLDSFVSSWNYCAPPPIACP